MYIHSCIRAIAASIVNIIAVNKDKTNVKTTDIFDATLVAEKRSNNNKWLAVKLLDILNVVFNDLKSLLSIFIPGKNKLNIKGIF